VIEASLETSFVLLSIKHLIFCTRLASRDTQNHLLCAIEKLLKKHQLSLKDLNFISVGRGPGAFTSTRIAICLAKTLCFSNQIPLVPFLSPMVYTPPISEPFLLLIDAKSRGVYAYNGADVTLLELPLSKCVLSKRLYSPHPSSLPFPTLLVPINIPFLVHHLETSFVAGKTVSPYKLRASYPELQEPRGSFA